MTALVTDEMLDEMAVAGTAARMPRRRSQKRARERADRLLLGAPVVATDPDRIRDYHDAIVETFGAARRAALRPALDCAPWRLDHLLHGRDPQDPDGRCTLARLVGDQERARPRGGDGRGPRPAPQAPAAAPLATPRPAGGGGAGCKPPPCPQTTVVRPARPAPVYARRAETERRPCADRPISFGRRLYCRTARESRCIPTLRFTRWSALSTVFVSHSSRSATSS